MRDMDVRIAVRARLKAEHEHDADTRIVEEMGLWNGTVRVDLAVINGEIAGYEIKSERDRLERLPAQAGLYNQVFDRVFLVAAGRHVEKATPHIPAWWGVLLAQSDRGTVSLEMIRKGGLNPDVRAIQLARLLWRSEALQVAESFECAQGIRSASRERIAERLVEALALEQLGTAVRGKLKSRMEWLGQPVRDQGHVAVCRDL